MFCWCNTSFTAFLRLVKPPDVHEVQARDTHDGHGAGGARRCPPGRRRYPVGLDCNLQVSNRKRARGGGMEGGGFHPERRGRRGGWGVASVSFNTNRLVVVCSFSIYLNCVVPAVFAILSAWTVTFRSATGNGEFLFFCIRQRGGGGDSFHP